MKCNDCEIERHNGCHGGGCSCTDLSHGRNARLIAAAAELREVFEAARAYLNVIQGDNSPEANALRAAIAKVETK